jgi:hypothetical protein
VRFCLGVCFRVKAGGSVEAQLVIIGRVGSGHVFHYVSPLGNLSLKKNIWFWRFYSFRATLWRLPPVFLRYANNQDSGKEKQVYLSRAFVQRPGAFSLGGRSLFEIVVLN